MSKKTIIAAALAASVATPAMALSTWGSFGYSGPYAYGGHSQPYASVNALAPRAHLRAGEPYAFAGQPYAYAPGVASGIVVADGEIIGRDPDPNVRLQLRRDALVNDNNITGAPYGF